MKETLNEIILKLPEYFLSGKAAGISMVAQLNLENDPMDYWTLRIENQHCEVRHEKAQNPQYELTVKPQVLLDILSGKQEALRTYIQGKLVLRGNIMQATKLLEMFKIPDDLMGKIR